MGHRITSAKCLTICLGLTFLAGCYLAILPIQSGEFIKLFQQ